MRASTRSYGKKLLNWDLEVLEISSKTINLQIEGKYDDSVFSNSLNRGVNYDAFKRWIYKHKKSEIRMINLSERKTLYNVEDVEKLHKKFPPKSLSAKRTYYSILTTQY